MKNKEIYNYINYLVSWLKSQVKNSNLNGLVVGVSGGIDSAVVARLIQLSFPNNHLVIYMPCFSSDLDELMVNKLVSKFDLNLKIVNLNETFLAIKKTLLKSGINDNQIILGNIKARLRMTTLYSFAQNNNYLVSGTSNKDEWHIGYFTKYGDAGVDLAPLINLNKSEVYKMAEFLEIPIEIIQRKPSAGLWEGQTDEKQLGFSYNDLDTYLSNKEILIAPKTIEKIEKLHKISEHKRSMPPKPNK